MYDADAIEAINFEQLVTATDRLLLRGGRPSKRLPGRPTPALGSHHPRARGSQPRVAPGSQFREESTVLVHGAAARHPQALAVTVVIPMLLGIAIGLAALL